MDIKELAVLLESADELKPLVDKYADKIKTLGGVAFSLLKPSIMALAELRADAFHYYISRGMSREEALQLCIADIQGLRQIQRSKS